jgi:polyphosphate kinase 2 (PPK2 family)
LKRFLSRLDEPEKNWSFSTADAKERDYWGYYMNAFEDTIRNTAAEDAPQYVVPTDNKWFTRIVAAAAVIDALADFDLQSHQLDSAKRKELAATRAALTDGKEV